MILANTGCTENSNIAERNNVEENKARVAVLSPKLSIRRAIAFRSATVLMISPSTLN